MTNSSLPVQDADRSYSNGSALSIRNLSKTFPGTKALRDVSFEVRSGSIHALIGGNGSGKSTLIKTLAGAQRGDPGGELEAAGLSVASDHVTAAWSRETGIRFVHQDLGLFDSLSVAENLMADGGYPSRFGAVRWRQVRATARSALARVGLELDVDMAVAGLRPALRTLVAIARALRSTDDTTLLVLDEPTAPLPEADVRMLLDTMRTMAGEGVAQLFVTHRLEEVLDVADTVTTLRDGEHVVTKPMAGVDEGELIRLLVGRPLDRVYPSHEARPVDEPALTIRGLRGGAVRGVDLEVGRTEILGIGGLVGSGRSTLLGLLYGLVPVEEGQIEFDGRSYVPSSPSSAMRAGFGMLPENRAVDGAFMPMTLAENLSIANVRRYMRRGSLNQSAERADARADVAQLGIRAPGLNSSMYQLSGGNQQKAILARWFRRQTRILLLDEPTVGVDIGSRAEIYRVVRAAADGGTSVILVSSDYEELAGVCDRVLVMADGRVVGEGHPPSIDRHWIAEHAHNTKRASAQVGGEGD